MDISITKNTQPPQLQKAQKKIQENRKTALTFKQKEFAKEFAKTKNGTLSALKVYDIKPNDYNTAGAVASENLTKPKIRMEIMALLQQNDIEMTEIFSTHKRNMVQTQHLPTSQKAVSDFYNILGMTNNDKPTTNTQVAFIINK